jgi:hypothetical protein
MTAAFTTLTLDEYAEFTRELFSTHPVRRVHHYADAECLRHEAKAAADLPDQAADWQHPHGEETN